ncbi:unnamed protein product, partial [Hymenolepis diminuta]|uniref:HTH psq-type domain-containing protein n=1 Tax=Hymenolepis diminuta TaxID=6216 RepID=A0A0R3SLH6_HYMDI
MARHDQRKSWEVNARHLAKHLQVSQATAGVVIHQDLGYKSH